MGLMATFKVEGGKAGSCWRSGEEATRASFRLPRTSAFLSSALPQLHRQQLCSFKMPRQIILPVSFTYENP